MKGAVQIDGVHGEGGGQILRTSLSLSALTGRAVEIINIRARRSKPGLQPQHVTSVRAAAAICDAELRGATVGSGRLTFVPRGPVRPDRYRFDIGTAGATGLVAQTVLIPLAHAGRGRVDEPDAAARAGEDEPRDAGAGPKTRDPAESTSQVTILGGTHVPNAPPVDYIGSVYLPALRRAGIDARFTIQRAGFYPRGGGEIRLEIPASPPARPLRLTERGALISIVAWTMTAELPEHVAERGERALAELFKGARLPVQLESRPLRAATPGASVGIAAECEGGFGGFSAMGERGKPIERVAAEAFEDFMQWWTSGAACDEHLADQLVLPMALARGESRWTTPVVSEHLRTVLWVAQQILPIEVVLDEEPSGFGAVTIRSE
jgi:RNA 3'-terminal phosphate cyclase (ATP)